MTLIPWVDAAYAPTLAEAQQAHQQGFRACGFYLPGIPNSDPLNVWTPAQVAVLHQAGLTPVPIAVPDPHLNGDPAVTATAAFQVATSRFGLPTKLSVLYDGPHLVNTGKITGPVWIPAPGPQPSGIGAGSAIQWGQNSISGWSVDTDEAAADFPFDQAIVCDFEHAILTYRTLDQAVAWYQKFQATIAQLATPTPPAPSPHPTPVEEDRVFYIFWAKAPSGQLAAFLSVDCMFFRWLDTPQAMSDVVNGTLGGKVQTWNQPAQPVADVAAFGTPANKATADLLGLAWP